MMQVWLFGTAAAINALAMLVHVVLGGRTFVRPLLASDLAPETTWMAYFMWHVATVSVAATAILFALAADPGETTDVAAEHPETAAALGLSAGVDLQAFTPEPRESPGMLHLVYHGRLDATRRVEPIWMTRSRSPTSMPSSRVDVAMMTVSRASANAASERRRSDADSDECDM